MDYTIGSMRVVCNPQGYQHTPNPEFRWDCVIEIDVRSRSRRKDSDCER